MGKLNRLAQLLGMRWRAILATIVVSVVSSSAGWAQYSFDPTEDPNERPGVRFFGSAKDDKGEYLPDVTFQFELQQFTYILLSNHDGRFRTILPEGTRAAAVDAKCWKQGFDMVRIVKRPGPARAARATVQVDCVLRSRA